MAEQLMVLHIIIVIILANFNNEEILDLSSYNFIWLTLSLIVRFACTRFMQGRSQDLEEG